MLKLGTTEDREDIKRLAINFFNASPYQALGVEEQRVEEMVDAFMQSRPTDRITILWLAHGKPVGVLAATAETNIFNSKRFAGELIWWIEPEHRNAKAAREMIDAYEYWAVHVAKAQLITMVDLLGTMDKYYRRKGYEPKETSYAKFHGSN